MPKEPSDSKFKSAERLAFEVYLRTGRRLVSREAPERKFNPYHDPRNGQFTFAPGGPRSISDPIFSDRRGLWKPKAKPTSRRTSESPGAPPKDTRAGRHASPTAQVSNSEAATSRPVDETPADGLKIHLPVAPREVGPLLRISATDDGAEYANCPEGGSCRATVTITPRDSNDVEIAINEYRRSVVEYGWKDNDFQNLVDMRRSLIAFRQKEAIASRIANWDPTKLLPEEWIAENVVDLALDDPDGLIGSVAYYLTLGIDGPGPRPILLTLENLMDPQEAALAQTEWLKKELIHQSYQGLIGGHPIFGSTSPVYVSDARPRDRGYDYEAEIRAQYGGNRHSRPPRFSTVWDGKEVTGQADHVAVVNGKRTAIDAKYTDDWMASLRNPSSNVGEQPWSAKAQREMITQAMKYTSAYEGGVIYHTNSVEFARFYSKIFQEEGLKNYNFKITPSR